MDLDLPPGLTSRALTADDAAAVTSVIAAQELADIGEVMIEEADIVAEWQRPGYDVPGHTVGVFDGDHLVAYAEVGWITDRADAALLPELRGRGLGTQLAGWLQAKAAELGAASIGMPVPEGSAGDRLLAALGWQVRWTSWVLRLPEGASVPERPLPDGYTIGEARDADLDGIWTVQEDAFLEWSIRARDTFEEWRAGTVLRPGFEPWHLRVVHDPAGAVVAMALVQTNEDEAFVARLATRKDQRGLGLGQALLVDAFAAGKEHGATAFELSTDSRTGALGLYEKVGMVTTSVWLNRTRALMTGLPDGLTSRPLTLEDAPAVHAAIAAEEVVDLGEPEMTLEDVVADWQRPSYDIATSTVGVFDGEQLVAYGDVAGEDVGYAAVLPTYQGRGIGTAIARWIQTTARERGAVRIGAQVPEGSAAERLMRDLGYRERWTAWDLELPEGAKIPARPLPDGFTMRDASEADREAAWTLVEDCFLEWSERERMSIEDFGARVWDRPGWQPWNLRLLHNEAGELVGAVHVYLADDAAYVARIVVRPDHRGRGLAPTMLVDAFALAREHGAGRCYLSTDTRAGARGLYEKVGMVVASTWVNRAIDL